MNAKERSPRVELWTAVALVVTALVGTLFFLLRHLWKRREQPYQPALEARGPRPAEIHELRGLSEEEAAARLLEGQDNAILFKPPRSKRDILRTNTLNLFNLILVGLALVQVLLGRPFDAVMTTVVLLLGIGLNVGQELWARGRLQKLEEATRPQATVVREGTIRSIDPARVVRGDVLVVGPGDPIFADGQVLGEGQIVLDESMLTGDPRQHVRQIGEVVYAGSFCLAGHAAYEAQRVGHERLIASLTGEFRATHESLTPLERTIQRLLHVLLVAVAFFSFLLLVDYFTRLFPVLHTEAAINAANVIFGLAPASLFFMILVNYAMGTYNLMRAGALVHRSPSVESLAQATVICLSGEGILTGVGVEVEPIEPPENRPRLAGARIKQILGIIAHSSSSDSPALAAMATAYPGSSRANHGEAPFLSVYGWSAIRFDDDDLRGVYVLGEPEVLQPHLASGGEVTATEEDKGTSPPWRERLVDWGKTAWSGLQTGRQVEGEEQAGTPPTKVRTGGGTGTTVASQVAASGLDRFRHLIGQVSGRLQRAPTEPETGDVAEGMKTERPVQEIEYMLAYLPELVPLHDADGRPRLPDSLVPLCRLRYTELVRPDAVETIKSFAQTGVDIKIFSSDPSEQIATVLEQAGLVARDDAGARSVSGVELDAMDSDQRTLAADRKAIFGRISPQQAGQVVATLREQSEVVAVLGSWASDLPAMQRAHLSITQQNSSPAALSVADIVLLERSSQALLRVLDKGQRIANGLLDVLKLYLNQIVYLILLILATLAAGLGFPYLSKQGSFVTIISVLLPSLGLTFWAPSGVVPRANLGWLLARFVIPAAVSISAAAFIVYRLFWEMTRDAAYTQLVMTYLLAFSGLVLVILLRPPIRPREGDDQRSGDWRPTVMVLVLLVLLFVVAAIPLANQLFGLQPLRQLQDYLIIGLAVVAWATVASLLWRIAPVERLAATLRR
ncbi:hypothetical protein ACFLWA_11910 [Chloroflexota bacterium]